jgi:hypothetical protein
MNKELNWLTEKEGDLIRVKTEVLIRDMMKTLETFTVIKIFEFFVIQHPERTISSIMIHDVIEMMMSCGEIKTTDKTGVYSINKGIHEL